MKGESNADFQEFLCYLLGFLLIILGYSLLEPKHAPWTLMGADILLGKKKMKQRSALERNRGEP
jgi:hypothetical protein